MKRVKAKKEGENRTKEKRKREKAAVASSIRTGCATGGLLVQVPVFNQTGNMADHWSAVQVPLSKALNPNFLRCMLMVHGPHSAL